MISGLFSCCFTSTLKIRITFPKYKFDTFEFKSRITTVSYFHSGKKYCIKTYIYIYILEPRKIMIGEGRVRPEPQPCNPQ